MLPKLQLPKLPTLKDAPRFPDVAQTPTPAGPVPIPYPNLGAAAGGPALKLGPLEDSFTRMLGYQKMMQDRLKAETFALGAQVALPSGSDSEPLAHELTHVLQQRLKSKV